MLEINCIETWIRPGYEQAYPVGQTGGILSALADPAGMNTQFVWAGRVDKTDFPIAHLDVAFTDLSGNVEILVLE